MIKTSFKLGMVALAVFLLMPLSAHAFMIKADQSINVPKEQVVDGNLYVAGTSIIVDGTVKGDLICAGQSIIINGAVDGDIICAGQSITILGPVGGSVRTVGNAINVNNTVARNVMAFGANIVLGANSKVGWDVLTGGATVNVNGEIGGNLHGGGTDVVLNGKVGKDVQMDVECQRPLPTKQDLNKGKGESACQAGLTLGDSAVVGGNVVYTSKGLATISPKAQVKGEIKQQQPKAQAVSKQEAWQAMNVMWLWGKIIMIFAALIIGLILLSLFKDAFKDVSKNMVKKPWASLGYGAMALFLTPLICVLLLFTIIGIPVAGILFLSWLIFLMLGKVVAAIVFGQWLFEKFNWKTHNIWPMVVGIVVAYLLFCIPVIGWLLMLIALVWGMGGLWFGCKQHCR